MAMYNLSVSVCCPAPTLISLLEVLLAAYYVLPAEIVNALEYVETIA
jgi:hypothetical protein